MFVSRASAASVDQPSSIGSVLRPDARDLVEVVHDGDEAEARVLGGPDLFEDRSKKRSGGVSGKV